MNSILDPDSDNKPDPHQTPTLLGVYELMQRRAIERNDVFLDRVASLMYGVATDHSGLTGCNDCDDGDRPCPWVETATEVAFAWLMREATR
jgi:hypothetical protein